MCVCLYSSVWLCFLGSDCGCRMSQGDSVAGSLHTSKDTHTHARIYTHMHAKKNPCGYQSAAPTYCIPRWNHTRKEQKEGESKGIESGVRGEVGTQKNKRRERKRNSTMNLGVQ